MRAPPGLALLWDSTRALAAEQHGIATWSQLQDLGWAPSTIADLVQRRVWLKVAPRVYAVGSSTDTPHRRACAAALSADGALTGWSAAWLWRLVRSAPTTVELIVPAGRRGTTAAGTRVRRSGTLRSEDVTVVDGIAVVAVPRMLVDLAGSTDVGALRGLAIDARQRGLLDVVDLSCTTDRVGRVAGVGRLRRLVDELGAERVDSVLEHRVRRLLEAAGLRPHPEPWPVTVGGETIFLDIAFPDQRVAVEPDGWAFHSTRSQLARDHQRSNLLQHTDWKVLRIGWHDVDERPREVVAELRALLRSRGWRPDGPGQPLRTSR